MQMIKGPGLLTFARFFPDDWQTESYSEMGSEKFSNSAKSAYNKGTIRSDIRYLWYQQVSADTV
jgi:hypothetical protein